MPCCQQRPNRLPNLPRVARKWKLAGAIRNLESEDLLDLVILCADIFLNLPIRFQFEDSLGGPRLRIRLRVVNRVIDLQGVMVNAAETLYNVQGIGMRKTHRIEPGLVVETNRVHDECISLVSANGVPHVCGVEILGMSPAIHKDLPRDGLVFEDHDDTVAGVNDFPGKRLQHDSWNAGRDTPLDGVWPAVGISRVVLDVALLYQRLGPWLERWVLLREKVSMVLRYKPNSREVRRGGSRMGLYRSRALCRLGNCNGRKSQCCRRENHSDEKISHHEPLRLGIPAGFTPRSDWGVTRKSRARTRHFASA